MSQHPAQAPKVWVILLACLGQIVLGQTFDNGFVDETTLERFPDGVPPPVFYSAVGWSDYNSDGRMDFLVIGYDGASRHAILYRQDNSGQFRDVTATAFPQGLLGLDGAVLAWQDYNNDNRPDVMIMGSDDLGDTTYTMLYRQTSSNTFVDVLNQTFDPVPPGLDVGSISWNDINGDGMVDVMLTGSELAGGSCRFYLYAQLGPEQFVETSVASFPGGAPPGVCFSSTAWGDYNGDLRNDFLLLGGDGQSRFFKLYTHADTQLGVFEDSTTSTTFPDGVPAGLELGHVSWGRIGPNNRLGFVLTGYTGSSPVTKLYAQSGAQGVFRDITNTVTFPQGIPDSLTFSYTAWADFNGDGTDDLWIQGGQFFGNRHIYLYSQSPDGIFTDVTSDVSVFPQGQPGDGGADRGQVAFADMNGDGAIDFFLTGEAVPTDVGGTNNQLLAKLYVQVPQEDIPSDLIDGDSDGFSGGDQVSGTSPSSSSSDEEGSLAWLGAIPVAPFVVLAVVILVMVAMFLIFLVACGALVFLPAYSAKREANMRQMSSAEGLEAGGAASASPPTSPGGGDEGARTGDEEGGFRLSSARTLRERFSEALDNVRTPRTPHFNHDEL